jgi:hypothetical protein
MLRLLSDANFNGDIVRGLLRIKADFDIIRVQDAGLADADDPKVLAWAAIHDRIIVTHDRSTMPDYAFERVNARGLMCGVFVLNDRMPVGQAIAELLLLNDCSEQAEWMERVVYLPL